MCCNMAKVDIVILLVFVFHAAYCQCMKDDPEWKSVFEKLCAEKQSDDMTKKLSLCLDKKHQVSGNVSQKRLFQS